MNQLTIIYNFAVMKSSIIEKVKGAPKNPGVYIFRSKKEVLYVGKAANLRNRLKSYLKITDAKTQSLDEEATKLDYISLRSEIEALIEESRLIKELRPKYNILWRDDKSYLYAAFTKEKFPKIFITHKNPKAKQLKFKTELVGPFTDNGALRLVMKLLRRYFPYCTCLRPHFRDCLNAQIGKCLGFCCQKSSLILRSSDKGAGDSKTYQKNIRMIKIILRGQSQEVKIRLPQNDPNGRISTSWQSKKLLEILSEGKEREALEKIFEHKEFIAAEPVASRKQRAFAPAANAASLSAISRSENNDNERTKRNRLRDVPANQPSPLLTNIQKVECYDISNFAGKEAVGAMTSLVKKDGVWQADKNSYRKFKIKLSPTRDDPRMMYEVVSRRLKHPEWPYPDLIIIDGGITQYRAALKAQSEVPEAKNIKITAYPKPQKTLLGWPNAPEEILKLAERAIYQTHNFVIRYHRKVRQKALFDIIK